MYICKPYQNDNIFQPATFSDLLCKVFVVVHFEAKRLIGF